MTTREGDALREGEHVLIHLPAPPSVLQIVDGRPADPAGWDAASPVTALPLAEVVVPVGEGPTMHRHPGVAEAFRLLAGELDVRTPEHACRVLPGDLVVVPAGLSHTYRSVGAEPAVLLFLAVP
jgi:mannose-6-phosphate isomerase-like protein (cupin superfamily)